MTTKTRLTRLIAVGIAGSVLAASATALGSAPASGQSTPAFDHAPRITNPYLPLSKQRRIELRGKVDGIRIHSVKTFLDRTEAFQIGGQEVHAAVVRDRAFEDGLLHEVALDYYAQATDGTVYYLGEDVNYYNRRGEVIGHHGSFRYGEDTQTLGVAMPAKPKPGMRYVFEDILGQGSERNRIAKTDTQIRLGGKRFNHVVKVRGFVKPEREHEVKWFARGIGVIAEQGPGGRLILSDYHR